jgi:hypothetical protein
VKWFVRSAQGYLLVGQKYDKAFSFRVSQDGEALTVQMLDFDWKN